MIGEVNEGSPAAPHVWRLTEFEHEVEFNNGSIADLKGYYHAAQIAVEPGMLQIEFRADHGPSRLLLRCNDLRSIVLSGDDLNRFSEDSGWGSSARA